MEAAAAQERPTAGWGGGDAGIGIAPRVVGPFLGCLLRWPEPRPERGAMDGAWAAGGCSF